MENRFLVERPPAHLFAREAFPAASSKSLHVLVVDDHVDSAGLIAKVLEMSGHRTRTVHDGLEVLEAARIFLPDVILLDIGLPGRNGYEVARLIRRDGLFRHTLLVALTGWDRDADRRAATEAGFDVHLAKPVDLDALLAMLNRVPLPRDGG